MVSRPAQHRRCPCAPLWWRTVGAERPRAKQKPEARPVVRWEWVPWLQAALGSNRSPSCAHCHLQLGLRCLILEGAKVSPSRVWRVSAQQGPAISAPPSLISTVMGPAPLHSECQAGKTGHPEGGGRTGEPGSHS